jgi:hypothetical protein
MTDPTSTRSGNQPGDQSWVKDRELENLFATSDTGPGPLGLDPLLPAVTARIVERRRNRRAAIAVGAATAVLVAGVATARFVGNGSDADVARDANNPGLTIRYGDQVYTFTTFTQVACTTDPSGHQVLKADFRPRDAIQGDSLVAPILSFEARPDLVADPRPNFELPDSAGNSDDNAFLLFTAVPVASGDDNEASSQEQTATGTVTITDLTCDPDPTFTITADAELGSEVSGPTIPIHGRITYPKPR